MAYNFLRRVSPNTQRPTPNALFYFLLAALMFVAGCNGAQEEGSNGLKTIKPSRVTSNLPQSGKAFTVGVSLSGREAVFDRNVTAAMQAAAEDNDLLLDVPPAEAGADRQWQQVEAFATKGVDAILLFPTDAAKGEAAIRRANAAKIPVFTAMTPAEQGEVIAHIGVGSGSGGGLIGAMQATLDQIQNPPADKIGKTAIETVARYLRGEKVKRLIAVKTRVAPPTDAKGKPAGAVAPATKKTP